LIEPCSFGSRVSSKIQDVKPSGYKKYDHYAWDVYSKMESLINESDELKKERESIRLIFITKSPVTFLSFPYFTYPLKT